MKTQILRFVDTCRQKTTSKNDQRAPKGPKTVQKWPFWDRFRPFWDLFWLLQLSILVDNFDDSGWFRVLFLILVLFGLFVTFRTTPPTQKLQNELFWLFKVIVFYDDSGWFRVIPGESGFFLACYLCVFFNDSGWFRVFWVSAIVGCIEFYEVIRVIPGDSVFFLSHCW